MMTADEFPKTMLFVSEIQEEKLQNNLSLEIFIYLLFIFMMSLTLRGQ